MRLPGRLILMTVVLLFTSVSVVQASVPTAVNYQGRLLDNAGVPVTQSDTPFVVSLWQDADSTAPQDKLYEETHTVDVSDGVYSFLIGNGTPVSGSFGPEIFSGGSVWLQLTVNSNVMLPRLTLKSTPFSFQTYNAQTIQGKSPEHFASTQDILNLLDSVQSFCDAQGGVWISTVFRCALGAADLSNLTLTGVDLSNVVLDGANFTNSDLSDANLLDATIENSDFTNTIWSNTTCPDGTNSDSNGNTCIGHMTEQL